MNITVCVSLARHPKSGRLMLAPNDARALAVARSLVDKPRLVHVGPKGHEWALRQYLGLGFERIQRIEPNSDDIAALLAGFLLSTGPHDLVLCGHQAQGQHDSGTLPYLVAASLGMALVDQVLGLAADGDGFDATQFLPKGKRRVMRIAQGTVVTVSQNAPLTLEYVARRARTGVIVEAQATPLLVSSTAVMWTQEPAKPGHQRLTIKSTKSGWDRFSQRMAVSAGGGEVIRGDDPEAASRVLDLLASKGLIS